MNKTQEEMNDMQFRVMAATYDKIHEMVTEQMKRQLNGEDSWLEIPGRAQGSAAFIKEVEKMKDYLVKISELHDKVYDFLEEEKYDRRDSVRHANEEPKSKYKSQCNRIFKLSCDVFEWGISIFGNSEKFKEKQEFTVMNLPEIFGKLENSIEKTDRLLDERINEYYGEYKVIHWNHVSIGKSGSFIVRNATNR